MLVEGQKRQKAGSLFAGVIYAPKEKATWREYIEQLELIALVEEPSKFYSVVEYLPLWQRKAITIILQIFNWRNCWP